MEISTENFTIAVDSKKFVSNPDAMTTLEGAMAVLNYALLTDEHKKLHQLLVQLLTMMMHEYRRDTKPKGWNDDKSFDNEREMW